MPIWLLIIIWIVVILIGAYGCFWILGQVGIKDPFNMIVKIVIGLVAIYLIASLFFPSLGVHLPMH